MDAPLPHEPGAHRPPEGAERRAADRGLADALTADSGVAGLDLDDLVRLSGAPRVVVEAAAREGLLLPHHVEDGHPRYSDADVEALRAGLRLLERGLPFPELVEIGRMADEALGEVADAAAEAFHRYVRDPAAAEDDVEAATTRLVDAYRVMLPSAVHVVAHRLRRRLIAAALERLSTATSSTEA